MGYIIEVTEDRVSELSEHIGKALRHAGKAMEIAESFCDDYGYGERGGRYGERDDEDWEEDDRMGSRDWNRGRMYPRERGGYIGMRRRRDSRGRYM